MTNDHIFSFMENQIESPKNIETKIRFSVSLNDEDNFITSIQNQRQSLIAQSPLSRIPPIITLKEISRKDEHLSTVEDHQSDQNESPLKDYNSISSGVDMEELKLDIDELENENMILRKENLTMKVELKEVNNKFAKELEVCQKRESQIMNDMQKQRKESLLSLQVSAKENSMKFLQSEVTRLESMMKNIEDQFKEERKFWDVELKEVEKKAIDAKMKYAQIMTERDSLELKCKQILGGRDQATVDSKKIQKNRTFFNFLLCND